MKRNVIYLTLLFNRAVIPAKDGFTCKHWKKVPEFLHPDEEEGDPQRVTAVPLDHVTAKRQDWLYEVGYCCYKMSCLKLLYSNMLF
jgi:hypothetical protein